MCRGVRWWYTLVVAVTAWHAAEAVVGGAPAAAPEPDAAVVFLQRRGQSARLEGLKDDKVGYYSFLGIRYAEPPLGRRRFQRPIRRFLAGEVVANRPCMPCPQPDPRRRGQVIGNEDCLCLSVYAPKMPGDEKGCPVIVFIHGGNYRSGSSQAYGGQHLTQKDTILVTMQYRLGSLGFLSTGQKDAAGNAGLFDMQAAYNWVMDYIKFFGGDPNRVVIMGQGSGGSAASLMSMSPEGRSAKGVVALSGAPLSPSTVRSEPGKHAEAIANQTGCPATPAEKLVNCLRKLPAEKIIMADSQMVMDMVDTERFLNEVSGRSGAGARVEGSNDNRGLPPLVEDNPAESLKKKQQHCPILTGVTSAETARAVYGKYANFLTDKLKAITDFIKKDLVGGLRNVVQGVEGLVPVQQVVESVLPLADYYQSVIVKSMKTSDGLMQIAEATGDALFNFPAYQSVQSWSEGAPAFLYSFEHLGNLSRGSHFLPGVALADDTGEVTERTGPAKGPSHGDELAYIFEPLDEDGKPLGDDVSSTDARVRNSFVGLISMFAHKLTPLENKNNKSDPKSPTLQPYSKDNDQYLKIGQDITVDKNFRFCQMGLWGNMADRVTGPLCKNLLGGLLNLSQLPVNLPLDPAKLPLDSSKLPLAPAVQMVPNLLGNQKKPNSPRQTKTTKKPSLLPFGL